MKKLGILEVAKISAILLFTILVLASVFRRNNLFSFFALALIAISINFWVRAKLGENPDIIQYVIVFAIYIIAIIIIAIRKETKSISGYPRSSFDEGH